jgi:hypothetical protein
MNSPAHSASSPVSFDAPIASTFSQLMISLPADEHDYQDETLPSDSSEVMSHHYAPYPTSAKSTSASKQPRRRRKRETIAIPDELVNMYDAQEIKRIKNRVAAARLRERSQQKIKNLEAEVLALRERNALLEARMAARCKCTGSSHVEMTDVSTSTSSPPQSPKTDPVSPAPSVRSPSSISDGAAIAQHDVMTEFESDLLHQLLWQSEEMAAMQMSL